MKTLKLAFLLAISLTLSFCGNDKKSSNDSNLEVVEVETTPKKEVYPEPALTAKFKNEKIANAYNAYSKLQNAFVNTNANDASAHATTLGAAMKTLGTDDAILQSVENIVISQDIKLQREQFVVITAEMEKILANSLDSGMIYKMYCPMAFKNTGAYWLSSEKQVQNPYFGDKMYRCGRVDDTIQ